MIRHEVVRVTPALAVEWLARPYEKQRKLVKTRWQKYARAMRAGRWHEPTIDPIAFTPDDKLLNGQHRLTAVVQTGMTVEMLIAYDVPAEQFDVIDTPMTRTAGQFIQMANASTVASTARTVLWYDRIRVRPNGTTVPPLPGNLVFDNDEVLDFVADHQEELAEAAFEARQVYRECGLPSSGHAALLFLARREGGDPDRLTEWVTGMRDGIDLGADDPRRLLRKRMSDIPGRQLRRNAGIVWMLMVRAFNAFMQYRTLGRLQFNLDDEVPALDLTGAASRAAMNRRYRARRRDHERSRDLQLDRSMAASGLSS